MNGALFISGAIAAVTLNVGLPAGAVTTVSQGGPAAVVAAAPAPPVPPGAVGPAGARTAVTATNFFYAYGAQVAASDGASGLFDVLKPIVATADNHSLAEVVVQSADGKQDVQVGWTVDRALNGDSEPHLFVIHSIDGKPACYNACGFVAFDTSRGAPGTKLAPGTQRVLRIMHFQGNWWLAADSSIWMGYFPDSLWGGRFTRADAQQWIGEVASPNTAPCTDMGSGQFGTASTGAKISDLQLFNSTASPNVVVASPTPVYYTAFKTAPNEFRYGGPGAC